MRMQGQIVHVCGCACKTVHTYETESLPSMLLYFKSCGCNMRHPFWHLFQPVRASMADCITVLLACSGLVEAGQRETFSLTL